VSVDITQSLSGIDVKPWIAAAAEFCMNTDFDVSSITSTRRMDLKEIMQIMKEMSMGKKTIQALADKLMLHRILENMGVPQMPALLSIDGVVSQAAIQRFVHEHFNSPSAGDVVVKPTHLSNGTGVLIVSQPKPEEVDSTIQFLTSHIQQFMAQKAGAHESVALRSLKPGFIVQPKFQSAVCFKMPLELRCITLWGRARLAVWWWGRGSAPGEFPHRNAWLVRRPSKQNSAEENSGANHAALTDQDVWQFVHEHTGSNPGFDKALELFRAHIQGIAACAEALATAVGAPFLRADFFVGSSKYGVRLNEVAYGCGVDYQSLADDGRGVEDAQAIARILQEGMGQCRCRLPPEHFLKRLGVRGTSYEDMCVTALPAWARSALPLPCEELGVESDNECVVPEDLCRTVHPVWRGRNSRLSHTEERTRRSHSWDESTAEARVVQQRSVEVRNRSISCSGRKSSEANVPTTARTASPIRRQGSYVPNTGRSGSPIRLQGRAN
jgi:hypothetical protein